MPKLIFVCLAAPFLTAIVTDNDPNHPNGPDLVITQGKDTDRPVYEVSDSVYIKEKIREGILEEVRDFDGIPRNSPEHPDHIDNPANKPPDEKNTLNAIAAPSGYNEEDVQDIVQRALDAQANKNMLEQKKSEAGQQEAIKKAVAEALAAAKTS